jgi:trehalose-phosphatase
MRGFQYWTRVFAVWKEKCCLEGENMSDLKEAMASVDEIFERLVGREPALFLDYDGTLAPIAPKPELAQISERMRQTIAELAGLLDVAVISGRGLQDVRERVGVAAIAYAGSHGFEIAGPAAESDSETQSGQDASIEKGREFLPAIEYAETELRLRTGPIDGVIVERKPFSVAVHYRQVADQDVPTVLKRVDQVLAECPSLRVTTGKKIFDLQPDIDWDKGKAVEWLLDWLHAARGPDAQRPLPIYIGDDVTDEHALRR